jgi:tRNA(fMet)-specific endonuclease VapC
MIAFDTDMYSLIMMSPDRYLSRLSQIPTIQRYLPIVVVEEVLRGRLQVIQQCNSGKGRISLEKSYFYFERTLLSFYDFQILSFTSEAEKIVENWKQMKIKVGTRDLRIGAICASRNITLVTRNQHDFELMSGLKIEVWKNHDSISELSESLADELQRQARSEQQDH